MSSLAISSPEPWESWLLEHQSWLKRIIYARVGEAGAVDDVFQEVATALSRQPLLNDPANAPAWLYRVAVRQCLLYRRQCGRRQRLLRRWHLRQGTAAVQEPDTLHWLLQRERLELLRRTLLELPPQDAELLLLKYEQGWRYQQMADHLGLSRAIVESRLHRARQRLRHLLQHSILSEAAS
jgi:RNA polymerase sigma factor (sigma-70 family)